MTFEEFYRPLHARFAPEQRRLLHERELCIARSQAGDRPDYLRPSEATTSQWRIDLPSWCRDQRNQMTGPADDAELAVKMLNSGAPGVMLDLEDSMVNTPEHQALGQQNVRAALYGELSYDDGKRGQTVGIQRGSTVTFVRVRGLHISQPDIVDGGTTSASLFDLAGLVYDLDYSKLAHPLCIYIPKSESADEA
ncbi:MAG TPA: hypothetical protein VIK27_00705, partial [Candidatus Aquilonibacter sp.]